MITDRELLLRIARSAGQRAGYKQLVRELGMGGGRERRLLLEQLTRLTNQRQLVQEDRDHWTMAPASHTAARISGRLDAHRDGFGFVRPEASAAQFEGDIFIPAHEMGGAAHGDQVLVEVAPATAGGRSAGRRSGRIISVLTRGHPTVVGRFHYAHGDAAPGHTVTPWDVRMTQPILIPFGQERPPIHSPGSAHRVFGSPAEEQAPLKPKNGLNGSSLDVAPGDEEESLEGLIVDVEITSWPTPSRPARGRVIEVLGSDTDFGVDVEIVIRKHHLRHVFPEGVLEEARSVARVDPHEVSRRRDFRHLPIVTIDGETAKDFDDAVLARKDDRGWELQVHIADVAQYVDSGSAIDLEARLRGTSVYFPDRAVPMLPQELSSGVCSLLAGEDRLVLSCLMRLDFDGRIESFEIVEGVIRSARRMTYTQVRAVLEGDQEGDQRLREEFGPLTAEFESMFELARLLHEQRRRRGSIDFDLPEPLIEFDAFGAMRNIVRSERSWANRLIEEFMLAANECVASWLEERGAPSLYRIHEKPEPRRVVEFEDLAAGYGYSLGFGALPVKRVTMKADRREQKSHRGSGRSARLHEIPEDIPVTPRMYQQLALKIAGKPEERILAYLMLRSLKQARYSEKNEGHFALATPCYTHFTSPIRRYPDLIVHRIAKALLRGGESGAGVPAGGTAGNAWPAPREKQRESAENPLAPLSAAELSGIARECSQTERAADEAERELMDWKKAKFMQERVGEDFDAMILSITKFGCFVELDNLFIEGLVPILSLPDDTYIFHEDTRTITGARTGRRFSVGDRMRVILDRVDLAEKRFQFSILDGTGTAATPARGKKPQTARKTVKPNAYKPPKNKLLKKSKRQRAKGRGKRR